MEVQPKAFFVWLVGFEFFVVVLHARQVLHIDRSGTKQNLLNIFFKRHDKG